MGEPTIGQVARIQLSKALHTIVEYVGNGIWRTKTVHPVKHYDW